MEKSLGHALFDRTTRQLRFTEIGEILCKTAIDSMGKWGNALEALDRAQSTNSIRLSLSSSLAMKWILRALPRADANGLSIAIDVKEDAVDFQINEADAAIRFGPGPYPGMYSTHLSHCWMQAVASPTYVSGQDGNKSLLADPETVILGDRRGEIDQTDFSWSYYLQKTGSEHSDFHVDHEFDRSDLMLQAAISGMGVALGRTLLTEGDVVAGLLEEVGPPIRMRSSYWLVCSTSFSETKRFQKLHDWLKVEIECELKGVRLD